MAKLFERVKRGDLITADLINSIMEELDMIAAPGKVKVPKLFGYSLLQAKSILASPLVGLVPGDVIATNGERIYPYNKSALQMVVLNQAPCAGEIVTKESTVDMVIASKSVAPGSGVSAHEVIGIVPEDGARVDDIVTIKGKNFVAPLYRNNVFFDDMPASPRGGSSATQLKVKVPSLDNHLPKSVNVCVEIDGVSKCLDKEYTIDVSAGVPPLEITDREPKPYAYVGYSLTLIGSGFDLVAQNNKIKFALVSDLTKETAEISPNSVSGEGESMNMKINKLSGFTGDLLPSESGTSFQIFLRIIGKVETAEYTVTIATPSSRSI